MTEEIKDQELNKNLPDGFKEDSEGDAYFEDLRRDVLNADPLTDIEESSLKEDLSDFRIEEERKDTAFVGNPYAIMSAYKSVNGSKGNYRYSEAYYKKKQKAKNRNMLIFSVIGLLLSALIFPGIVFSVIGLMLSAFKIKNTKSQVVKWAFYLGIVGVITNLAMLASFIIFI